MLAATFSSTSDIVFLFAAAGILLYIASRAAADAMTSLKDPSPSRLALAQWMPIAWAAIIPTALGRHEIGVGIVFATSVGAIGLILGILLTISPDTTTTGPHVRSWPFIVPSAMLCLLAGFSGTLNWLHGVMLFVLGACVLAVWLDRHGDQTMRIAFATPRWSRVQLLIAIGLGAVGAWMALKGISMSGSRTRVNASGLISLVIVSPLLLLPMLGTCGLAAHNNRFAPAATAIVGVVLLNLCLLLPMVILAHYMHQLVLTLLHTPASTILEAAQSLKPMPFPLAVWRVDTVLLLVIGLLLIPVSQGRWQLRRVEGLALAFTYAAYLIISTAIALRV